MVLGKICLNLSMLLYLIVYIPQLIHNRRLQHLNHLSLFMHVFLFQGYVFDLLYGVITHMPWQYLTVSTVGLSLLTIQHIQLTQMERQKRAQSPFTKRLLNFLLILNIILIYATIMRQTNISSEQATLLGWLSRAFFTLCFIPQLFKNYATQTNHALSPYYLSINILITSLDFISAWCLNWGWPNKIGPVISLTLLAMLLSKKPSADINRSNNPCSIS